MKKVMTISLLMLSYLIITASAGNCDSTNVFAEKHCPYEEVAKYDGPPGEIVQGKPSLPSDVSFEQSVALDAYLDILTGAIGSIPGVGALLAGYFTAFRTIFSAQQTEEALEKFYNALSDEVDAIINYVDQKVLQLQVEDIKNKIGGLETAALHCTNQYSGHADDMKTCLVSLQLDIIGEVEYFFPSVPENPTLADTNEHAPLLQQLLPMWRHYCDLYLAVTLELVSTIRHTGDDQYAMSILEDIPSVITKFNDFYNAAKPIIRFYSAAVQDPEDFIARQCKLEEGNNCAFQAHTYDFGRVTGVFGPSSYESENLNCRDEYYVGCKDDDSESRSFNQAFLLFWDDQQAWINLRLEQVDVYYRQQFERTITNWNSIKEYILGLTTYNKELQQRPVTWVRNPSYNTTFHLSKLMHVSDGIRNDVFEIDVDYKAPRYCSSEDCHLVYGCAEFDICISNICQKYSSGTECP